MERRDFKSTQEQWKVVVDFLEVHPSLLKGKFSHFDGDSNQLKRLWDELTLKLNSMGLGARSTEKWQLAISRWKSKTKSKASQLRMEMEKTGGGPIKTAPLNPIEERLMALMGWKSVTGDRNVELGLVSSVPALARATTEPVPSTSRARTPSPPTLSEVDNTPPPLTPLKKRPAPESTARFTAGLQGSTPKTKRTVRFTSERSRRMVTLSQMHRETQQRLGAIEKNTQIMATALQSISQDFNRLVNKYLDKNE